MIVGAELARWLARPEAQAATAAAMEDFGRRFRRLPALLRLEEEVRGAGPEGRQEVLAAARRFMNDEEAARACVDTLVEAASADPFFRPPLRVARSEVHEGLLLFDTPALTIQLAAMSAERLGAKREAHAGKEASISFSGQSSLFRFLRSGGATLSIWETRPVGVDFRAEASGRCRLVERRRLSDGDWLELDGRRTTFVVEHAPADLVYLQASTPIGAGPLMVEFDSSTHEFVGASSTDDASSRTQMMLALLRLLDRRDAAPLFAEMLASPHFYARWQTMREFLALDAEAALPHLRRMAASDPHPEVRAAADATLAMLVEDDELAAPAEVLQPCPA